MSRPGPIRVSQSGPGRPAYPSEKLFHLRQGTTAILVPRKCAHYTNSKAMSGFLWKLTPLMEKYREETNSSDPGLSLIRQYTRRDSNPQPTVPKTVALSD